MPVIKGAGESYEIGTGRIIAPGTAPPAWFTEHEDLQVNDGGGDPKCVLLKEKASKCMQEKGSYQLCAQLVEAYNICFSRALQSRMDPEKMKKLEQMRKEQGPTHTNEAEILMRQMEIVQKKYNEQRENQMTFALGAAETSQAIAEAEQKQGQQKG